MDKNKLWLLDAHCDAFEMQNFLEHDFQEFSMNANLLIYN